MRKIIKLFKILLPLVLIYFLVKQVSADWDEAKNALSQANPTYLLISFLLLTTVYPEAGFAWHKMLSEFGFSTNRKAAVKVWVIANTSRYIPGTIWQYVGRAELAKKNLNLDRRVTAESILAEIFLVLIAGSIVSVLSVPYFKNIPFGSYSWIFYALPFAIVALHPSVAEKTFLLIAKVTGKDFGKLKLRLTLKSLSHSLPLFALNFIINGLALFFLSKSIYPMINPGDIVALTGFYALSWLIGFLAIIFPAGIGVTDAVLTFMLASRMPLVIAATIALSYRFLLTISELAVFIIAIKLDEK